MTDTKNSPGTVVKDAITEAVPDAIRAAEQVWPPKKQLAVFLTTLAGVMHRETKNSKHKFLNRAGFTIAEKIFNITADAVNELS